MTINKTMIISFLVGVFALAFAYQIWINWEFQTIFNSDHMQLQEVVNFLNKSIQAQQPQSTPVTK